MENENNQNVEVVSQTQNVQVVPTTEVSTEAVPVATSAVSQAPQPQVIVQEQTTQPETKKKKIDKNTLIRIIAGVVILLGVGVYLIFFHKWDTKLDVNNPKSVLNTYFNLLIEKDYSNAFNYVYLPNSSIVDSDDFFSFISNNKNYSDLTGKSISKIEEVSKSNTVASYNVLLNDSDKKYDFELYMLSTGEWKIKVEDLYIENWKVEVPGDSKLYINDNIVEKSLSSKDGDHDIYSITIAPGYKKFKISTQFEDFEKEIIVAGSNNGEKVIPELTKEEEINSALEGFKKIWNGLYTDYTNNTSNSDVLKKYFDSTYNETDMNKYYTNSFDSLTAKSSKNYRNVNAELESIKINDNKKSYIEAEDIIKIEFGYKVKYTIDYKYEKSKDVDGYMTRYSSIVLKKTNDGYLIHDIIDTKLFSYLNLVTKEY